MSFLAWLKDVFRNDDIVSTLSGTEVEPPFLDPERKRRALRMIDQMDAEGFGNCSNHAECEAVCPKEISISTIAKMRREYLKACGR